MTAPLSSSAPKDCSVERSGSAAIGGRALFDGETTDRPVPHIRPIRVMHVTNGMTLGGTEKVVLRLANALTNGFDHQICCIRAFDADLVRVRLRPEQFTALERPQSRYAILVPQLMRAIRSCNPDIVHSRNWGAIEAVFAARLAGVPVVIHSEHGYDVGGLRGMPLRQKWIRRMAYSAADAFFVVSRELRDFHAAQAGIRAERIGVLYNGVDVHSFAPNPESRARVRSDYGIRPGEFVMGAVGRMAPIKDYPTLIRAAGVLLEKGLNFRLMLVGDGPEVSTLANLAESFSGLRERVIFSGQSHHVPELLSAMDVFVQTSLHEGMSNTTLEAMAAGLPPVVTDVGGNPEIIEDRHGGWLFKPGDVESLADLLHRLALQPELRSSAGQAARRRVQEMFSSETMLGKYRTLYLELAARRGVSCAVDQVRAGVRTEGNGLA